MDLLVVRAMDEPEHNFNHTTIHVLYIEKRRELGHSTFKVRFLVILARGPIV
jgi:hypothetical protein